MRLAGVPRNSARPGRPSLAVPEIAPDATGAESWLGQASLPLDSPPWKSSAMRTFPITLRLGRARVHRHRVTTTAICLPRLIPIAGANDDLLDAART